MARPPVDSRLKNIEKSQQKIEGMLKKIVDSNTNTDASNDQDTTHQLSGIQCQCEKVTVESTDQEDEEGSGESQDDK